MGLGGGALRGYLAYHCRLFFFSRCSGTTDEYRSHPIILAIALLGGISDVGRSPFCGSGYHGGGGPGLTLLPVSLDAVPVHHCSPCGTAKVQRTNPDVAPKGGTKDHFHTAVCRALATICRLAGWKRPDGETDGRYRP